MDINAAIRDAWCHFYANDTVASEQALRALAPSAIAGHSHCYFDSDPDDLEGLNNEAGIEGSAEDVFEVFTEYTFFTDRSSSRTSIRVERNEVPQELFPPSLPYESCGPAPHNIRLGDDPEKAVYMPYADDPTFNVKSYALEHVGFQWQQQHFHHFFSPGDISFLLVLGYRIF